MPDRTDEKGGPAKPDEKRPAPRKLVIGGIVVCDEGEMLTPEEFGARVAAAFRKAFGHTEEDERRAPRYRLLCPDELAAIARGNK
jgi:hypothetical protein